ncbi:MAG: divergent polysaccharide deacetylase family protein [Alphaproteobacteria bacterium]|nr:divergent polysaccharide deacetylase family protein [Alphaproteobacteria bacterium]MDD9920312.1 divergent polysaccharide deacetylase family protein [Alphaproteobacteria bacterium]
MRLPENWHKLPWLDVAALVCTVSATLILFLVLAVWQLPTWRKHLQPVAQHVIHYRLPVLAHYPEQYWFSTSPRRSLDMNARTPRYVTNATPVSVPAGTPRIAIVIDDMGVATELSQNMLDAMPKEVTMAFLPYGRTTLEMAQLARMKGHEIMIHLPMQPQNPNVDPGPNALFVEDDLTDIRVKIAKNIARLKHISVGVNNHMGSAFTSYKDGMAQLFDILRKERLFFLDSVTTTTPASQKLKYQYKFPIIKRDIFLDHYIDADKVDEYLAETEKKARKQGFAIAIGHPHVVTREALRKWIPTLQAKGIRLVPITNVLP